MPSWIKKLTKPFRGSSGKSAKFRPRAATWSADTESTSTSSSKGSTDEGKAPPSGTNGIRHVSPAKTYQYDENIGAKLKPWENSVVVVTGATAGIGSSICISLVRHGFIVIGCSKTAEVINVRWQKHSLF